MTFGRLATACLAMAACNGAPAPSSNPVPVPARAPVPTAPAPNVGVPWPLPVGWRHETLTFPLEFSPSLTHRGIEELRFPPGFLEVGSPNRWSYAFTWRLEDSGVLGTTLLSAELTTYFRDLLVSVDGDKKRITSPREIVAWATPSTDGFALTAHIIDAFGDAAPLDLVGSARRTACGSGALWVFVLAPKASPIRNELDVLAMQAMCGQPQLPATKP